MQTFFRERRYVRYFIVQEEHQEHQEHQEQQQSNCERRLSCLLSGWETLKREDGEATERMAEEASAKDRTGWFQRTRWAEHLHAYPYWRLLSCDEPELKQVALAVESWPSWPSRP